MPNASGCVGKLYLEVTRDASVKQHIAVLREIVDLFKLIPRRRRSKAKPIMDRIAATYKNLFTVREHDMATPKNTVSNMPHNGEAMPMKKVHAGKMPHPTKEVKMHGGKAK